MRQMTILTVAVWIAVIAALFGATGMIAKVPQMAEAAAALGPIDIVQMTKEAKNLPVEAYDAN